MKIPYNLKKDIDKLKDDTLEAMFKKVFKVNEELTNLKVECFDDIDTYMQILSEEYKVNYNGKKGNLTITNSNQTKRIVRAVNDFITFDERLQVAKELIDKCISKWSGDVNDNIKVLVNHAFEVDKKGKISTDKVLGLKKLDIKDEDWQRAMKAISDSTATTSSKSYVRFYHRQDQYSPWEQVILSIANVE